MHLERSDVPNFRRNCHTLLSQPPDGDELCCLKTRDEAMSTVKMYVHWDVDPTPTLTGTTVLSSHLPTSTSSSVWSRDEA